ncbi:MAG: hypothetical protein EZS28_013247, partial [Streblomastix strix]
ITLLGIGGQGFSNKNTFAIHGYVQQLVAGNSDIMMHLSMAEGGHI